MSLPGPNALIQLKKSVSRLKIQNSLVGESLDMVRLEPIIVRLKRNTVVKIQSLEFDFLD